MTPRLHTCTYIHLTNMHPFQMLVAFLLGVFALFCVGEGNHVGDV